MTKHKKQKKYLDIVSKKDERIRKRLDEVNNLKIEPDKKTLIENDEAIGTFSRRMRMKKLKERFG